MNSKRFDKSLILVVILMLLPAIASAKGQQYTGDSLQATITFIKPDGTQDIVGDGQDFATVELGDPWDMNQASDIWGAYNMSNGRFENGAYYATTSPSNNSYLILLWQGYPHAQNIGKTGQAHPIDASKYHRVSVALCSTHSGTVYFFWFYGTGMSNCQVSNATYVYPGCGIYVYDLHNSAIGHGEWTGAINGFRIDPKVDGGDIEVHWVRLTADPTPEEQFPILWQGLSPSGANYTLNLYADANDSSYNGWLIYTYPEPSSSGVYQWGETGLIPLTTREWPTPTDMEAGNYYLYAEVVDIFDPLHPQLTGYSLGPVTVKQTPFLRFTNPSYTSGPDYATDTGDPWDMDGPHDVERFRHVTDYHFSNGKLYLENTNWDPGMELASPAPINTSKYRFLTVRSYSERERNVDDGTVARVFWYNDPYHAATAENIIIYKGWQTYSVDLSRAALVAGSPLWTDANWATFRWDPNENVTGQTWHNTIIDDIKLTGPPEANTYFLIQWEFNDPENENVSLTLYYDTNNSGFDGIRIGQAAVTAGENLTPPSPHDTRSLSAEHYIYLPLVSRNYCTGNCLRWNTSGIPNGEYYIYGCLNDGVNQVCYYSDVPVLITH